MTSCVHANNCCCRPEAKTEECAVVLEQQHLLKDGVRVDFSVIKRLTLTLKMAAFIPSPTSCQRFFSPGPQSFPNLDQPITCLFIQTWSLLDKQSFQQSSYTKKTRSKIEALS